MAAAFDASASGHARAASSVWHSRFLKDWVPSRGLELARGELLATGETARRRGASATETLTRQELRIAQILASGKTTRETAAALFLSPKTIEYHLRSIYGKLGVNSRSELGWRSNRGREVVVLCSPYEALARYRSRLFPG